MQVFITDPNPSQCAITLDDVRLKKVGVLESAQLLSTALHMWGHPLAKNVYKPTHVNHPLSIWVREKEGAYTWLVTYLAGAINEFRRRTGYDHKTQSLFPYFQDADPYLYLTACCFPSSFPNCSHYPDWEDVFQAYQQTLIEKWEVDKEKGNGPQWMNANPPAWYRG